MFNTPPLLPLPSPSSPMPIHRDGRRAVEREAAVGEGRAVTWWTGCRVVGLNPPADGIQPAGGEKLRNT